MVHLRTVLRISLMLILCPTILFSQVRIREKVEIRPNPAAGDSATYINSLRKLQLQGGSSSGFFFQIPANSFAVVSVIEGSSAATINLVVRAPFSQTIVSNANANHGFSWGSPKFSSPTAMELGIHWYYSGSQGDEWGFLVEQSSDSDYVVKFEDIGLRDRNGNYYTDLIVSVSVRQAQALTIRATSYDIEWGKSNLIVARTYNEFGYLQYPPDDVRFTYEIVKGQHVGTLQVFKPGVGIARGTILTDIVPPRGYEDVRFKADGEDIAYPEQVEVRVSASDPTISPGLTRFTVRPSGLAVTVAPKKLRYGEQAQITLALRAADGTILPFPEWTDFWYSVDAGEDAGYLIAGDGSEEGDYIEADFPNASFLAREETSQPDSVRVAITVSASADFYYSRTIYIDVIKEAAQNHPPVIDLVKTSTGDTVFAVGSTITLEGYYHDEDNDVVSAQWTGPGVGPPTAVIKPNKEASINAKKVTPLNSNVAEPTSQIATATISSLPLGENIYTLTVTDTKGLQDAKQLSLVAFPECLDQPNIVITPYLQDDNLDCATTDDKIPGGATYADFASQIGTDAVTISACYDRIAKKIRLHLLGFQIRLVYGVCLSNLSFAGIRLINSLEEITEQEACTILKEFDSRVKQLQNSTRSDLMVTDIRNVHREELLTHEYRHVQLLEKYLRDATDKVVEQMRAEFLSRDEATVINQDAYVRGLRAAKISGKIKHEYDDLKNRDLRENEFDAQRQQGETLKILRRNLKTRFPNCQ